MSLNYDFEIRAHLTVFCFDWSCLSTFGPLLFWKPYSKQQQHPNTGKFSQSFLYITFKNLIVISFYQLIGYLVMYTLQFDQKIK